MSEIHAGAERLVHASAEQAHAVLADYRDARPALLTRNFLGYEVLEGGAGAGTLVAYRFRAGNRERPYRMRVSEPAAGRELLEQDEDSSLRTTWTVEPADGAHARVRVESVWQGGGGIGGFFERRFAPLGLRRVYGEMLDRLDAELHARYPHEHPHETP